jgi:hypothetical protein
MLITDKSQLIMLQNVISPKSSVNTTATIPNYETFKEVSELTEISTRDVISKKEATMGKSFTILEASSKFGKVNITTEEAAQILDGVKVFELVYKVSSAKTKEGDSYVNLVIKKKATKGATQTELTQGVQNEN